MTLLCLCKDTCFYPELPTSDEMQWLRGTSNPAPRWLQLLWTCSFWSELLYLFRARVCAYSALNAVMPLVRFWKHDPFLF